MYTTGTYDIMQHILEAIYMLCSNIAGSGMSAIFFLLGQ